MTIEELIVLLEKERDLKANQALKAKSLDLQMFYEGQKEELEFILKKISKEENQ